MSREPGWYWVIYDEPGDWEPAEWDGRHWQFIGSDSNVVDALDRIGSRILPPDAAQAALPLTEEETIPKAEGTDG